MKRFVQSLGALPLSSVSRQPDVLLALFVAMLVAMLLIPFPPAVLDVLLATNLAASVLILVVTLFAKNAVAVSTFPTLLLITTLFRLGLNVSTTRLILTKGDAGEVVRAFGAFVVQGDLVVGLVIFLLLTLVQLLVVGKGAERVAEVAARFTLDAMPGKQMSIDAAVRAGSLTEAEAQQRRDELSRESQLFGAMDGAMKFVKGDAVAGLVIVALNLVAGFIIGVARRGMSFGDAAEIYAVLSIGDALVAQIPALLITLSAGVLTTRVSPKEPRHDLGRSLQSELFASPKVLGIGGGLAFLLACVPGLPGVPFVIIASALAGAAWRRVRHEQQLARETAASEVGKRETFKKALEAKVQQAKAQRSLADQLAPAVVPIQLELDPVLSRALGLARGDEPSELNQQLPSVRDLLFMEHGVRVPGVRVVASSPRAARSSFVVRIREVPVLAETLSIDEVLVCESPARLKRLGIDGRPTRDPLFQTEASFVAASEQATLEAAGLQVYTASGLICLHLTRVLRRHLKSFIGLQEVSELLERLEKAYPALVKEVVPKVIGMTQLVDVLRRLVDEGVSIRDFKAILEALSESGAVENDPVMLTESVRAALSLQIGHSYAGVLGSLKVVLLDPLIEDTLRSAITPVRGGTMIALEPELASSIIEATARTLRPVLAAGVRPVILTDAAIRRYVRKLYELEIPEVAVLSYQELPADLTIHPMGRVVVREAIAA